MKLFLNPALQEQASFTTDGLSVEYIRNMSSASKEILKKKEMTLRVLNPL